MFGIKTLQNVKDQSGTTTAMFGINCYSGKWETDWNVKSQWTRYGQW
jgi:hypothetical protein